MLEDIEGNELELIGFLNHNNRESKAIALLQAVLREQANRESPLEFKDIYRAFASHSVFSNLLIYIFVRFILALMHSSIDMA